MEKHVFEYVQRDRKFVVEVGELAKQANGAVLVQWYSSTKFCSL